MTSINSISSFSPASKIHFGQLTASATSSIKSMPADDAKFAKVSAPKISRIRLLFNRLTDEQIKQVNESGMLPENAKFYSNGMGGYALGNNFFNISTGTRQLPAGYELQKNLLGFTVVVPKGSDGLFVNKAE